MRLISLAEAQKPSITVTKGCKVTIFINVPWNVRISISVTTNIRFVGDVSNPVVLVVLAVRVIPCTSGRKESIQGVVGVAMVDGIQIVNQ